MSEEPEFDTSRFAKFQQGDRVGVVDGESKGAWGKIVEPCRCMAVIVEILTGLNSGEDCCWYINVDDRSPVGAGTQILVSHILIEHVD